MTAVSDNMPGWFKRRRAAAAEGTNRKRERRTVGESPNEWGDCLDDHRRQYRAMNPWWCGRRPT